jgi:hypothetical protein
MRIEAMRQYALRVLCYGCSLGLLASAASAATSPRALLQTLDAAGGDQPTSFVECGENLASDPSAVPLETAIQYLPAAQALLAWRVLPGSGGPCLILDWPQQVRLSGRQAAGLQALSAAPMALRPQLRATVYPGTDVRPLKQREDTPIWRSPAELTLAADRSSLPWCPQTLPGSQLQPVPLADSVAPLVLRVRPYRCRPGSRPTAGSGVLLSPNLALTAAHVVLTSEGLVCDRYRLVPGGRRYSDPPAAPFGTAFVSRAFLSERGGWRSDAAAAPDLNQGFGERTAHDYAFLMLDQAATLPADIAWPRLRFDAPRPAPGMRVLRAGYGVIGPAGRIAPGGAVNLFGQYACPRGDEPFHRFALWMSPGASGGPIWRWSDPGQAFELLSLAVRMETYRDHQHETLGPRFDQGDYQRLLGLLAQPEQLRRSVRAPVSRVASNQNPPQRRETARSQIARRRDWRLWDCTHCEGVKATD